MHVQLFLNVFYWVGTVGAIISIFVGAWTREFGPQALHEKARMWVQISIGILILVGLFQLATF